MIHNNYFEIYQIAKEYYNNNNYILAINNANKAICIENPDCCKSILLVLNIKSMINNIKHNEIEKYIEILTKSYKINNIEETFECIKFINNYYYTTNAKSKIEYILYYNNTKEKINKYKYGEYLHKIHENIHIVKINNKNNNIYKYLCDEINIIDVDNMWYNNIDDIIDKMSENKLIFLNQQDNENTKSYCQGIISCYELKNKLHIQDIHTIELKKNYKLLYNDYLNTKKYEGLLIMPKTELKCQKQNLPKIIMMIGKPGSGKSRISLQLLSQYDNIVYINRDDLGQKKCVEIYNDKNNKNKTFIIDNCNLTINSRSQWFGSNIKKEDKILGINFLLHDEICINRVKSRLNHPTLKGSNIENVINTLNKQYEEPKLLEGYNEIITIKSEEDLIKLKNRFGFGYKIDSSIIKKFPRTKHLINLGAMSRDDLLFTKNELDEFLTNDIIIEEKVDGANLGIFYDYDVNEIKMQNRSHYVNSSIHSQFKLLDEWIKEHKEDLMKIFNNYNCIIYGEWLYTKHSINYTKLPNYFMAFDIYDKQTNSFFSRQKLEKELPKSLSIVPKLYEGKGSIDLLKQQVNNKSNFYEGLVEGVYVRVDKGDINVNRGKIVRSDFLQTNVKGETIHWTRDKQIINTIINNY